MLGALLDPVVVGGMPVVCSGEERVTKMPSLAYPVSESLAGDLLLL